MQDEDEDQLQSTTKDALELFECDPAKERLLLAGLTSEQRAAVHRWATREGFASSSVNLARGRVLVVRRHARVDPPPAAFLCPISQTLMDDPVLTRDGFTYERTSIETWFRASNKSPMTNLPLDTREVIPNIALRQAIEEWRAE